MKLEHTLWWRFYIKWERYLEAVREQHRRDSVIMDHLSERFAQDLERQMVEG